MELDATAEVCPLCQTPVLNPRQPVDAQGAKPFPTRKAAVPDASKWAVALLLSAMLASVSICCGVLNLFLRTGHIWSLYVIGVAVMFWIWFVPPLLLRGMHLCLRLILDVAAVGIYVLLIAIDLDGRAWFLGLALPIVLLGGAVMLFLGLVLQGGRRSLLSSLTLVIGSVGLFLFGVEFLIDRYFAQLWQPSWSLIILAVCIALVIPLLVVRRIPSLREEARRRFHM
ncbi:MAG: DUF6320 domain-containing protein [Pseudoflavonifractor sp.]